MRPSIYLNIFLLSWGLLLLQCQKGSDYYLVIDTSGSMGIPLNAEGKPANSTKNSKEKSNPKKETRQSTLTRVQFELKEFIKNLKEGDTVTLLRFDNKAETLLNIEIKDEKDKARIINEVQSLEAKGRYTDMEAMLAALEKTSKENRTKNKDRPQILIVMSDGKDDPPPQSKRRPFDLSEVQSTAPPKKEGIELMPPRYYVYYVSLGKVHDRVLEKRLSQMSDTKVKVVQGKKQKAGPSPRNVAHTKDSADSKTETQTSETLATDQNESPLAVVQKDIQKESLADQLRFWGLIALAVLSGIFLLLLLIWLFLKFKNRHKPQGKLIYYEKTMGPNMKEEKDLSKLGKSSFSLGSKTGVDVKIRDLGVKRVHLKAAKMQGENVLRLANRKEAGLFDFKVQARPNAISNGDVFQLGNCVIEYKNEPDAKK